MLACYCCCCCPRLCVKCNLVSFISSQSVDQAEEDGRRKEELEEKIDKEKKCCGQGLFEMAVIFQALSTILLLSVPGSSTFPQQGYMSGDSEWDHIVFTQQWPESACEHENSTGRHTCEIPSQTKSWTVHGLWPSSGTTRGPNYCNDSWPFDPSAIESILPELKINWPNLFTDTELTSFWEHEWVKHGTCAASLESLRGEKNYFTAGLSLKKKYDILGTLSKRGISPSRSRGYGIEDIIGVLQDEFGHRVCVGCSTDQDVGQLLYQVYICIDKNLSTIDCPSCSGRCRSGENLVYHPIENESTHKSLGDDRYELLVKTIS